jgi:superfamily II DNA or RNA helicase
MNLGEVRYSDNRHGDALSFVQKVLPRFTSFSLPVQMGNGAPDATLAINDIFHSLSLDQTRNEQIAGDILAAYSEGRECLVLSERIEHLAVLEEMLTDKIPHLFILKGGMGKKQLRAIMDNLQNVPANEHRIILATGKYLGEGFDLPCLDTLFLVFPFSWKGTLIQYTGRLNRAYYGKKEIQVYDYVDEKVPVLSRMYGRRMKGYKSMGFFIEPSKRPQS